MKHFDLINTLVALGIFSSAGLAGNYLASLSGDEITTLSNGLNGTKIVAAVRSESITRAENSLAPRSNADHNSGGSAQGS